MREHADGQLVAHASACPVGTHADARRRTGHATCKINSAEESQVATSPPASLRALDISRQRRVRSDFHSAGTIVRTRVLNLPLFIVWAISSSGFPHLNIQALWWGLGEWLVLALIYRIYV